MQYATFTTNQGIMTGIVESVNAKTVRVTPVRFGPRSMITKVRPVHKAYDTIVRNIKKHNVRIYPANIVPIN